MASVSIEPLSPERIADCERILRALPLWFGIPDALDRYVASLSTLTAFAAAVDDRVVGFVALSCALPESVGIHVMAVDPLHHRQGVGRLLIDGAQAWALSQGARLLYVMTLAARADYAPYESTRAFYRSVGFVPLLETTSLWGEENPTLIMVKVL